MSVRPIIGIVSYNTREQLRGCLTALRHHVARLARIVVVDNASDDGSTEMVEREFPEVLLLSQSQNRGFGAGCNVAIRHAAGGDVLLMNPDVEILPGAMEGMLEFLNQTPDAAAISPLLVGSDGAPHTHLYRRFPSIVQVILFWTILRPISSRIPWLRQRYFEHDLRGAAPVPVDQLPGGAILIRASVLRVVGEFDPDYFLWFEDVDWCYRARQAGYRLLVLPSAQMRHEGGASFRSWTAQARVHQFYRALVRFLCKHRLDRMRRWALPILTVDLRLKEAFLRIVDRFHSPDRRQRFAAWPVIDAMRDVVTRHRAGELVSFTNAGYPGTARESRERTAHASTATSTSPQPLAQPALQSRSSGAAVDAIIVNWNGCRYLPGCIAALRRSTIPVRILVVDSASTDGSSEYLRSAQPDVETIELQRNRGYSGAANEGLRRSNGQYAFVMNPDLLVAPDHLGVLKDRLDRDATVGAAQGKLYQISEDEFNSGLVRSGGRLDSAGHVIRRSRMVVDRGQGEPDKPEYHYEASIFSACGAALFLRRSMLEDVAPDGEYFSESFFAYKEDIDLGWRARLLGWDVRYVPGAVAHHVRAAPLDRHAWRHMPLAARRHSWKNHYLLMVRNDRAADLLRALPFIGAWELTRLGYALLRDPRVLTAYLDLARALPAAARARRTLLGRRRATSADMRRWFGAGALPVKPSSRSQRSVTAASG